MEAQGGISILVEGAKFRGRRERFKNSTALTQHQSVIRLFVLSVLEVECQEGRGTFEEPFGVRGPNDADVF
jgi:hypothetical protein